jgi:hypothetical protein
MRGIFVILAFHPMADVWNTKSAAPAGNGKLRTGATLSATRTA